ncbi:MAG: rhodanese-like domain-containing protein [Coleofasciculus sp. D1-CHI-01]|uniref:rhodanese-like domain-containing protein n=1 Tax=Coleofasciculus sp. D1-CHI-01 TaxID=3068482 RepID=UPI0032F0FBD3
MNSVSSFSPSVKDCSPQEFVHSANQPLLIDVRSGFEYAMGHAPSAINLSLPRIIIGMIPMFRRWVLPQWFQDLPKDKPIAVICLTAHRSPIAAKQLAKSGFAKVFNITGGMVEWRRLGLEIQTHS